MYAAKKSLRKDFSDTNENNSFKDQEVNQLSDGNNQLNLNQNQQIQLNQIQEKLCQIIDPLV